MFTFISALLSIVSVVFIGLSVTTFCCCKADGTPMQKKEQGWSLVCLLVALLSGVMAYKLGYIVLASG